MKVSRFEFPTGQNWSCHGCSDCCRGNLWISLLPQDRERIEKQNWTAADGIDPAKMIVAELGGWRLGHQPDDACIFLDAAGRCRIHAKFGESEKPLACRLYPFVVHPAGKKLLVGLRFSCPSAGANRGRPMAEQGADVQKLARLFLPEDYDKIPPPPVVSAPVGDWADLLRFAHWLDVTLATDDAPLALKLLRALHWLGKIEQGRFEQISGEGADEIIGALVHSAAEKMPQLPSPPDRPSGFGRLFLRMLVLEHARTTTLADRKVQSPHRWKMLAAALRLLSSSGHTPALRAGLQRVKISEIEKAFGPLSSASEALLTRYFRVKIQSLHFCGRAFYNRPLVEGFRNLALLYPIIVWLARWLAASQGRSALADEDVQRAVTLVDYQYGFAPYLGWRTRLLQQRNDIARLCAWHAT
ncbi:MAG TPA: YkgJ family cysteine cluster protein [Verrucomicrobiae bacterium]